MGQSFAYAKPVILVVEDDFLLRLNAIDILEEDGFRIEEADCAENALKILETSADIQLMFTNIQMPGAYNGLELVRLVHARWPSIKLVLTSGMVHPMRAEIPDDGRFIGKPYPSQQLLDQVHDLLEIS